VVGTEEGFLHKCSAAFNAEYVASYARHDGAVYAVAWNRRHARVFLSASADWTVRLWHDARPKARARCAPGRRAHLCCTHDILCSSPTCMVLRHGASAWHSADLHMHPRRVTLTSQAIISW